jgi:hypothetical protein
MEWHVRGQRNPLKAGGNLLRLANFSQIFFTVEKEGGKRPPATQKAIGSSVFPPNRIEKNAESLAANDLQMRQSELHQIAHENGWWTLFRVSNLSEKNRAFLALPALFQTLHSQAQSRHGGADQPRPAQGRLVRGTGVKSKNVQASSGRNRPEYDAVLRNPEHSR